MAIVHDFEYHKPKSIEEVVALLEQYHGNAKILAGGTDLIVHLRENLVKPNALIDIKGIDSLREIKLDDDNLSIGALVTFNDLIDSKLIREHFPILWEMAWQVASTGVRNRATVVGNICSASPCCDSGPVLLVHDAVLSLQNKTGSRNIAITNFFVGPRKTSVDSTELVTGITIKRLKKSAGCFVKLGRYQGEDLAQASVAIHVDDSNQFKIAFGSVGPKPLRAQNIEALLNKTSISNEVIQKAKEIVSQTISPISDIRASKTYRMYMSEVMLERGIKAAISRLENNNPTYGTHLI